MIKNTICTKLSFLERQFSHQVAISIEDSESLINLRLCALKKLIKFPFGDNLASIWLERDKSTDFTKKTRALKYSDASVGVSQCTSLEPVSFDSGYVLEELTVAKPAIPPPTMTMCRSGRLPMIDL